MSFTFNVNICSDQFGPAGTSKTQMSAFIRLPAVVETTGLSKTEVYRRVAAKTFPPQRKLSPRVSVWVKDEVDAWKRRWVTNADLEDILG